MSPALCLHFAGVFLSYFLQMGLAYLGCCLLNRMLPKPRQRFFLWMVFLLGAGTYWLGVIWAELRGPSAAATSGHHAGGVPVLTHSFLVPFSWSRGILTAGKMAGLAYLFAVVLLVGVAAWRRLGLQLLLRRAIEPSPALARLFQETCRDFRVARCRLLVLPGLRSPATTCWWNPRILLPEICEELGPTPQMADVLFHELVHVARRDYLWSGLSDLVCRVLFFHPAAWQAGKRLRLQGELACDLAVVEARPARRADYAGSLAYFVRLGMLQERVSVGVDFAASSSTLGTRIRAILAAPQPLSWWKAASRVTAGLALVAATGILSPALEILFDFRTPAPAPPASQAQIQATPVTATRIRNVRRATSPGIPLLPQKQEIVEGDSLTSLRVRPRVGETAAYTLTAGAATGPDAALAELDKPNWNQPNPSPRTVSSIILSTVSQIPVARIPHGRDHDRDTR